MSGPTFESRREAEAAMAARRELGAEYEADIAAGLAERVEQALRHQHAAGDRQLQLQLAGMQHDRREGSQRFALTIISLATGIPVTAIAAGEGGLVAVVVSWAGIVGVNAVFAISQHRNRRR